jgi:hypothetical protein
MIYPKIKKKFPVAAAAGAASKYQPNDPLFVEFAPAYHVVSRLYARTPVIVK